MSQFSVAFTRLGSLDAMWNVAVDKARHHCLAGEIDDLGAGRFDKAGFNRGDAIVVDEDGNLAARVSVTPSSKVPA